MSALYRRVLLPPVALATRRDAEVALHAHLRVMRGLQASPALLRLAARRHARPADPLLVQDLLDGLRFPHPFGVAAGYDKNAAVYPAFEAHFTAGFVEVGTVTLRPQQGNPRPRVHRLPGGHLVNAMGFPNAGAEAVLANLRSLPAPAVPLGVNVGKLKDTPDDPVQRRDLGATLLHAGRPGEAIDHLRAYLETTPDDAEAVRQLLERANAAVARWN